jgi:hypothetical protein
MTMSPKDLLKLVVLLKEQPELLGRLEMHAKLRSEQWCKQCGVNVAEIEKFCRNCGAENPEFDPVSFEEFFGGPVDQVVEEDCLALGHPINQSDENYCMMCGKKLKEKIDDVPLM